MTVRWQSCSCFARDMCRQKKNRDRSDVKGIVQRFKVALKCKTHLSTRKLKPKLRDFNHLKRLSSEKPVAFKFLQ